MEQVTHVCGYQLQAVKDITPEQQKRREQDILWFTYYPLAGGKQAPTLIICPKCGRQLKPFDLSRPDGSTLG